MMGLNNMFDNAYDLLITFTRHQNVIQNHRRHMLSLYNKKREAAFPMEAFIHFRRTDDMQLEEETEDYPNNHSIPG